MRGQARSLVQLGGLGQRYKLLQRGSGQSPVHHRVFLQYVSKRWVFLAAQKPV